MNPNKITALSKESEADSLRDIVYAKLDAQWRVNEFLGRHLVHVPDLAGRLVWWHASFTAERAVEAQLDKEAFLKAMSIAYDEAAKDAEEEETEPEALDSLSPIASGGLAAAAFQTSPKQQTNPFKNPLIP